MKYEQFKQARARLTALCATREALFKTDPRPTLNKCLEEMSRMDQVLRDVETALRDTNWVYDEAAKANVPPQFYRDAQQRLSKARAVLDAYFRP